MSDPIDRQAAIDAVCRAGCGSGFCGVECDEVLALRNMPPAQPEPCGDVVSRNAIVQKLNEMDRYVSTELRLCDTDKKFPQNEVFIVDDVYEEIVEQLPSAQPDLSDFCDRLWKAAYERGKAEAQPDIIHCGECKFLEYDSIFDGHFCRNRRVKLDHFCGYTERRTDEL